MESAVTDPKDGGAAAGGEVRKLDTDERCSNRNAWAVTTPGDGSCTAEEALERTGNSQPSTCIAGADFCVDCGDTVDAEEATAAAAAASEEDDTGTRNPHASTDTVSAAAGCRGGCGCGGD